MAPTAYCLGKSTTPIMNPRASIGVLAKLPENLRDLLRLLPEVVQRDRCDTSTQRALHSAPTARSNDRASSGAQVLIRCAATAMNSVDTDWCRSRLSPKRSGTCATRVVDGNIVPNCATGHGSHAKPSELYTPGRRPLQGDRANVPSARAGTRCGRHLAVSSAHARSRIKKIPPLEVSDACADPTQRRPVRIFGGAQESFELPVQVLVAVLCDKRRTARSGVLLRHHGSRGPCAATSSRASPPSFTNVFPRLISNPILRSSS